MNQEPIVTCHPQLLVNALLHVLHVFHLAFDVLSFEQVCIEFTEPPVKGKAGYLRITDPLIFLLKKTEEATVLLYRLRKISLNCSVREAALFFRKSFFRAMSMP